MSAVEAAVRKHEAIETDIVAYSERVQAVSAVAAELEAERYHDLRRVLARRNNVARLWDFLRQLVAARRERLLLHLELQKMLQDLAHLAGWMEEMKVPGGGGFGVSGWVAAIPVVFLTPSCPAGPAAVAGFREAPARGGRPAADPRAGGGRHRGTG